MYRTILLASTAFGLTLCSAPAFAADPETSTPSLEEMWRIIQAQQAEISRLKGETNSVKQKIIQNSDDLQTTRHNVEAVADAVEGTSAAGAGWWNNTSIGGYGELHYNGGAKDQLDFHRFVLFLGHEFTDTLRFQSEIELEHAFAADGEVGEIELEQAYLELDVNENTQVFGGVHLVPVGIINETHEPPTFYGVERNAVEKNIIPTTL